MNILFVCTGNTCRSSMAEGIFNDLLKDSNKNIFSSSAGIRAYEGEKANEKSILLLNARGIDISSHRAKQLTADIIANSDIILTMTAYHKDIIINSVPEAENKVYTLKEYAYIINGEEINKNNLDIADPYGMDYNAYETSMKEIETEIKKIINNIDKLKSNGGKI
mgnify:FL=1